MIARRLALALAGLVAWAGASAGPPARRAATAPPVDGPGQSIYLRGVLGSGEPLRGSRGEGLVAVGADAACVNCHQRSGLGSREGKLGIPPVTGPLLFAPRAGERRGRGQRSAETDRNRPAYTDETLARAIREGLDSQGRPLGYLMPRYRLGDEDMAALVAYLRQLGGRRVPGVTRAVVHFATVITPGADPQRRRGMLDVLEGFVARRNQVPILSFSGRGRSPTGAPVTERHWQLHVWEISGPASTWRAQLEKRLAAEPVYAVLSGVGGSDWAPVHEFCEQNGVPCLFPNVEVPVVAERDFYPVYFSRGVLLEADLIARAVLGSAGPPDAGGVEQVYRAGDSGEAAAEALRTMLQEHGVAVHGTALPARAGEGAVAAALRRVALHERGGPALVLWLRPADLAALARVPARASAVYLSGLMGGLESAPLPAAWRERALMTYPFDLPGARIARVDHLLGYLRALRAPLVDEQVQTDTLVACNVVAEALAAMADGLSRPRLVEELEHLMEHELMTGYYPRLALGSSQRFASRGGYLVRFRDGSGSALVAQGDWLVP
jgi:hypothetical protein